MADFMVLNMLIVYESSGYSSLNTSVIMYFNVVILSFKNKYLSVGYVYKVEKLFKDIIMRHKLVQKLYQHLDMGN